MRPPRSSIALVLGGLLAVGGCGVATEAEPVLMTSSSPPALSPTATSVQPAPARPSGATPTPDCRSDDDGRGAG